MLSENSAAVELEGIEAITAMVKGLVDRSDLVSVTAISGNSTLFTISVDLDDLAKVIGKNGNKITSIRNIISGIGAKYGKKTIVEIAEDRRNRYRPDDRVRDAD